MFQKARVPLLFADPAARSYWHRLTSAIRRKIWSSSLPLCTLLVVKSASSWSILVCTGGPLCWSWSGSVSSLMLSMQCWSMTLAITLSEKWKRIRPTPWRSLTTHWPIERSCRNTRRRMKPARCWKSRAAIMSARWIPELHWETDWSLCLTRHSLGQTVSLALKSEPYPVKSSGWTL